MPADRFAATDLPTSTILTVVGVGLFVLFGFLAVLYGLDGFWANGPQVRVQPRPLASAATPHLETGLFRVQGSAAPPDPRAARAMGYRWADAAHTRVDIPIERAMAIVAARGPKGFDPPAACEKTSPVTDTAVGATAPPCR